jgi:hypothetical protein
MRSPRISALRPPRPSTPKRVATKEALWSLQLYASGYKGAQLPADMRPISIDEATETIGGLSDEHAMQRRTRVLRRFRPQLFKTGGDEWQPCADEAARETRNARWRTECHERFRVPNRPVPRPPIRRMEQWSSVDVANPDFARCVATADDPDYDPVRGRSRLYSTLTARRCMDLDLAQLLDPRGWDECSDLFEDTFEVEPDGAGGYREKPTPPKAFGRSWQGLLYEFADVGPQAVENILWVRFAVTRLCDGVLPYYLDPERRNPSQWDRANRRQRDDRDYRDFSWRGPRYDEYRERAIASGSSCPEGGGDCGCPLDAVEIQYELHDSLSYRVGPLTLPGMMRQNSGYLRAWSRSDGYTDIECVKNIRFGRLSRWSISGAFDFGEMLNYTAAAFLSLWIGEIEQIVPCCTQRKAKLST